MKKIYLIISVLAILGCTNNNKVSGHDSDSSRTNSTQLVYRFQINFDVGSSNIKSKYLDQIKEFAGYLKSHKGYLAQVHGHTDSDGSDSENKLLSQERANAVVHKLIQFGVKKKRLEAIGYGEASPIATNYTSEGKFENRRVEARLKGNNTGGTVLKKPGTIKGSVTDALTGNALAGVSVKVYSNGKLLSFLTTDSRGLYRVNLEAGNYILKFARVDYLLANVNVNVVYKKVTTVKKLKQISTQYSGTGTIGGVISNASNGRGVANLRLVIRKNWNNKRGTIIKRSKTDASGKYRLNLASGYYTIEAYGSGFSKTFFNVVSVGKNRVLTQNSAISPQTNGAGQNDAKYSCGLWTFILHKDTITVDIWAAPTRTVPINRGGYFTFNSDKRKRFFKSGGKYYFNPNTTGRQFKPSLQWISCERVN